MAAPQVAQHAGERRDAASVAGQEAHSWEAFYAPKLTWYRHLRNVLHHLPMFRTVLKGRPRRVLEVGAGSGSHSIFVSYFGPSVVAADLSRPLVERSQLRAPALLGRASFLAMDAFRLGFPDGSFDVAFSQGVYEHFSNEQIAGLLAEQTRVARRVVISVPNRSYSVQDFGDERLLTRVEWEALFEELGYRVLESRDYAPVRARWWRGGRDMYLAVVERA